MPLIDMRSAAKTEEPALGLVEAVDSRPAYPFGLSIELNDESLSKLGIEPPPLDTVVAVRALAKVTATGSDSTQDGKVVKRASLQITDLELLSDDGKTPAQRLYTASGLNP